LTQYYCKLDSSNVIVHFMLCVKYDETCVVSHFVYSHVFVIAKQFYK